MKSIIFRGLQNERLAIETFKYLTKDLELFQNLTFFSNFTFVISIQVTLTICTTLRFGRWCRKVD